MGRGRDVAGCVIRQVEQNVGEMVYSWVHETTVFTEVFKLCCT